MELTALTFNATFRNPASKNAVYNAAAPEDSGYFGPSGLVVNISYNEDIQMASMRLTVYRGQDDKFLENCFTFDWENYDGAELSRYAVKYLRYIVKYNLWIDPDVFFAQDCNRWLLDALAPENFDQGNWVMTLKENGKYAYIAYSDLSPVA